MIKLAEYVASFLSEYGVKGVFGISGGASLHLIHALRDQQDIVFVCPHHEQGAAMAADGYSRSTGKVGVAVATSGPGATNLITGICCSYYDSVAVLFLTGQVSTFREVGKTGVRQIGFQETPITEIVKPVTKYCVKIDNPYLIKYELQKALHIATSGRPGPVLIDIPDNLQREMIDPDQLVDFKIPHSDSFFLKPNDFQIDQIKVAISNSNRPILVAGWGVMLAGVQDKLRMFARRFNIPVAATWGASNILSQDDPLYVGTFGTHGMRSTNFAVQNSDLIISFGSRLDTKATGTPVTTFARGAFKVMIDIDLAELEKFSHYDLPFDILVHCDLRGFFAKFEESYIEEDSNEYKDWFLQIDNWRTLEKVYDGASRSIQGINPYDFFTRFSQSLAPSSKIFIDTGCSIAWAMQTSKFDQSHGIFHDFNNTAMGWSLPASVGSIIAFPSTSHYCIVGDGSFMMTMQELAMVQHHRLPLKIVLINNGGYSMIKQTQDQWLANSYVASGSTDLSFPNFSDIAKAFGIRYLKITDPNEIDSALLNVRELAEAVLCEVVISPAARVMPQTKAGRANEDMEPLLPRKVFDAAMIVPSLPSSK